MRTTIVAVLCVLAIVAAGCDDTTPTGPTNDAAFRNFMNTTPDGIRGQDLGGRYDITFTAAAACSQLPSALRSRTLTGQINPRGDRFLSDRPFIEPVGPSSFMTLVGTVHPATLTPSAVLTPSAPFTASFDGTISFCSALTSPTSDNLPPMCGAPVQCRSDQHQIRFIRR